MYNFDGQVKNCIRSAGAIGNIKKDSIRDILAGATNLQTQSAMLQDLPGRYCTPCYDLENGKRDLNIVSDRIFYIRELKTVPLTTYYPGNYLLKSIDVRWSNLCNFSCVYCNEDYSSRWANELDIHPGRPTPAQVEDFKRYIFDHAADLAHVYLAGGEPLLMKENLELLQLLKRVNFKVNLRINTNLSTVDTRVFELICEFPNVHWTVSVESQSAEFEYIRFGGRWQDFLGNLSRIRELDHKISFNMLHFLLNFRSLFDCVDFLRNQGYHANAFVIGSLLGPDYLNIRHLPDRVLQSIGDELEQRIAAGPGYLLEDSYRNLLTHIRTPFMKNLAGSIQQLQILDRRRGLDSRQIFTDLYQFI